MKVITHKDHFVHKFQYKAIKLSQKELVTLEVARVILDAMLIPAEINSDYAATLHRAEQGLFEILDEHKKKDCFQLKDTIEVEV